MYPDAKKVLLTAYADTDAAIEAINDVGLDHYLMKPWDPPEERLYPVLDELLDDWEAEYRLPRRHSRHRSPLVADSHDIEDFLARNQIPYRFLDVETDPDAKPSLRRVTSPPPFRWSSSPTATMTQPTRQSHDSPTRSVFKPSHRQPSTT